MLKSKSVMFGLFVLVAFASLVSAVVISDQQPVPPTGDQIPVQVYGVNYNFVSENSIKAYSCRNGPFPSQFPNAINNISCNREFLDITSNPALDVADKNAVGGLSWTNYASHHFFVLRNVSENNLKKFEFSYVVLNKYQNPSETHFLYVRNFDSGQWELLANATALRLKQGFMNYTSSYGSKTAYVNDQKEMWFMGSEGATAGKAASSDTFSARLSYECTPYGIEPCPPQPDILPPNPSI